MNFFKRRIRRTVSLITLICFSFTSTGFSQGLAPIASSTVMSFNPPSLKYLSVNVANPNNYFNFLVDKGQQPVVTKGDAEQLINYFFLGIMLPDKAFWVNLKPQEPDKMTSPELSQTDLGKVLLEQDFRLKKDMSQYLSPKNPVGKEFWEKLYTQIGRDKVKKCQITTSNRVWIVPDKAIILETEDGVLLVKSSLKVLLESEYASLQNQKSSIKSQNDNPNIKNELNGQNDSGLQKLTESLMKQIIIPAITKDVNESDKYMPLRQIYHSLILAQWFKQKYKATNSVYANAINKGNTTGFKSQLPWEKQQIWQDYLKSFNQGEYNFVDRSIIGLKRMYFSGGIIMPNMFDTFSPIVTKVTEEEITKNPDITLSGTEVPVTLKTNGNNVEISGLAPVDIQLHENKSSIFEKLNKLWIGAGVFTAISLMNAQDAAAAILKNNKLIIESGDTWGRIVQKYFPQMGKQLWGKDGAAIDAWHKLPNHANDAYRAMDKIRAGSHFDVSHLTNAPAPSVPTIPVSTISSIPAPAPILTTPAPVAPVNIPVTNIPQQKSNILDNIVNGWQDHSTQILIGAAILIVAIGIAGLSYKYIPKIVSFIKEKQEKSKQEERIETEKDIKEVREKNIQEFLKTKNREIEQETDIAKLEAVRRNLEEEIQQKDKDGRFFGVESCKRIIREMSKRIDAKMKKLQEVASKPKETQKKEHVAAETRQPVKGAVVEEKPQERKPIIEDEKTKKDQPTVKSNPYDIIISDIDRTLTKVKSNFDKEIIEKLLLFIERNIHVVFVTAQSIEEVNKYFFSQIDKSEINRLRLKFNNNLTIYTAAGAQCWEINIDSNGSVAFELVYDKFKDNLKNINIEIVTDVIIETLEELKLPGFVTSNIKKADKRTKGNQKDGGIEIHERGAGFTLGNIPRESRIELQTLLQAKFNKVGWPLIVQGHGKTLYILVKDKKGIFDKGFAVENFLQEKNNIFNPNVLLLGDSYGDGLDQKMADILSKKSSIKTKIFDTKGIINNTKELFLEIQKSIKDKNFSIIPILIIPAIIGAIIGITINELNRRKQQYTLFEAKKHVKNSSTFFNNEDLKNAFKENSVAIKVCKYLLKKRTTGKEFYEIFSAALKQKQILEITNKNESKLTAELQKYVLKLVINKVKEEEVLGDLKEIKLVWDGSLDENKTIEIKFKWGPLGMEPAEFFIYATFIRKLTSIYKFDPEFANAILDIIFTHEKGHFGVYFFSLNEKEEAAKKMEQFAEQRVLKDMGKESVAAHFWFHLYLDPIYETEFRNDTWIKERASYFIEERLPELSNNDKKEIIEDIFAIHKAFLQECKNASSPLNQGKKMISSAMLALFLFFHPKARADDNPYLLRAGYRYTPQSTAQFRPHYNDAPQMPKIETPQYTLPKIQGILPLQNQQDNYDKFHTWSIQPQKMQTQSISLPQQETEELNKKQKEYEETLQRIKEKQLKEENENNLRTEESLEEKIDEVILDIYNYYKHDVRSFHLTDAMIQDYREPMDNLVNIGEAAVPYIVKNMESKKYNDNKLLIYSLIRIAEKTDNPNIWGIVLEQGSLYDRAYSASGDWLNSFDDDLVAIVHNGIQKYPNGTTGIEKFLSSENERLKKNAQVVLNWEAEQKRKYKELEELGRKMEVQRMQRKEEERRILYGEQQQKQSGLEQISTPKVTPVESNKASLQNKQQNVLKKTELIATGIDGRWYGTDESSWWKWWKKDTSGEFSCWKNVSLDISKTKSLRVTFDEEYAGAEFYIRLLPEGVSPGNPTGLNEKVYIIPNSGVVEIPISEFPLSKSQLKNIRHISVHSGNGAWKYPLSNGNKYVIFEKIEEEQQFDETKEIEKDKEQEKNYGLLHKWLGLVDDEEIDWQKTIFAILGGSLGAVVIGSYLYYLYHQRKPPKNLSRQERAELKIAAYESGQFFDFAKDLKNKADKLKIKNPIWIVSNLSYGRFVVAPIEKKLKRLGFEMYETKIGSTECHNTPQYMKLDLFDDKLYTRIINEQPIIIVVDGTKHTMSRPNDKKSARYPDAYVGYRNLVVAINDVLSAGQPEAFLNKARIDENFLTLLRNSSIYKNVINKLKVSKDNGIKYLYSMEFWNPNKDLVLVLREARKEVQEVSPMNIQKFSNFPALIFVNSVMLDENLPEDIKKWAKLRQPHTPAFYDDNDIIKTHKLDNTMEDLLNNLPNMPKMPVTLVPSVPDFVRQYDAMILDLDGTLAETQKPIEQGIADKLSALLKKEVKIAIITSQDISEVQKNVIDKLDKSALHNLLLYTARGVQVFGFDKNNAMQCLFDLSQQIMTSEILNKTKISIENILKNEQCEILYRGGGSLITIHVKNKDNRDNIINAIKAGFKDWNNVHFEKAGKRTINIVFDMPDKDNTILQNKNIVMQDFLKQYAPQRILYVGNDFREDNINNDRHTVAGGLDKGVTVVSVGNKPGDKLPKGIEPYSDEGPKAADKLLNDIIKSSSPIEFRRIYDKIKLLFKREDLQFKIGIFDVDDTLTAPISPISKDILSKLLYLMSTGMKVGIVTVQSLDELKQNIISRVPEAQIPLLQNLALYPNTGGQGWRFDKKGNLIPLYDVSKIFLTPAQNTIWRNIMNTVLREMGLSNKEITIIDGQAQIIIRLNERGNLRDEFSRKLCKEIIRFSLPIELKKFARTSIRMNIGGINKSYAVKFHLISNPNVDSKQVLIIGNSFDKNGDDREMWIPGARVVSVGPAPADSKFRKAIEFYPVTGWQGTNLLLNEIIVNKETAKIRGGNEAVVNEKKHQEEISKKAQVIRDKHKGIKVAVIGATAPTKGYSSDIGIKLGGILKAYAGGKDCHVFTGGVGGVGEDVYRGFGESDKFFVLLPEGMRASHYKNAKVENIGQDMYDRRIGMGKVADVVIVLNGGSGTMHEAITALNEGKKVIVLPYGGAGAALYQAKNTNNVDKLSSEGLKSEHLANIITANFDNDGERKVLEIALTDLYTNVTVKTSSPIDYKGGIDLSKIELTLKDEKFISKLNPADIKILRAAKAFKNNWNSLASLYIYEVKGLMQDKIIAERDITQKALLQKLLIQLEQKDSDSELVQFRHIIQGQIVLAEHTDVSRRYN